MLKIYFLKIKYFFALSNILKKYFISVTVLFKIIYECRDYWLLGPNDRYRIKVVENFIYIRNENFDKLWRKFTCILLIHVASYWFSISHLLYFVYIPTLIYTYSYFFTKYSKCSIFSYTFFMLQLIYRCTVCFTRCFHITIINLKIISWLRVTYEYVHYCILYDIQVLRCMASNSNNKACYRKISMNFQRYQMFRV